MSGPKNLTLEGQILLRLGRANQVKYPTLLENIERCDSLLIDSEDIDHLIDELLEYTEQMEKEGKVDDSIIPLVKCFELSKQLDDSAQAQKMVVLARLTNKLESTSIKHYNQSVLSNTRRQINKAKTALYTTLAF